MKNKGLWFAIAALAAVVVYGKDDAASAVKKVIDPKKAKGSIPERMFALLDKAKAELTGAALLEEYARVQKKFRRYLKKKKQDPAQAEGWFKDWGAVNAGAHPDVSKPETEEEKLAANKKLADDILADLGDVDWLG